MRKILTTLNKASKNVLVVAVMLGALMAPTVAWPTASVVAAPCESSGRFLTFPHWHRGISRTFGGECVIDFRGTGTAIDTRKIWLVALNITDILLQLVGYIAAGFVLYGGVRYLLSNGNSDSISKARDTIIKAMIGMVVAMSSAAIVGFVVGNM